VLALSKIAPVLVALTVTVPARLIESPAYREMFPAPPLAVTSALIVKSSAAVVPSAASVICPPPVLLTLRMTVSGPAAVFSISSPTAPAVILTPLVPPPTMPLTPVISNPPATSRMMMSPLTVVAARPRLVPDPAWATSISS